MTGIRQFLGLGVQKKKLKHGIVAPSLHLPMPAKAYITALTVASLGIAVDCVRTWQSIHMGQFALYLACATMCSTMKVWLPGITGTLSVHYLFILVAVSELTLPQTVVIACISGVAQLLWSARASPSKVQILFAFTSMSLSSTLVYLAYHSRLTGDNVYLRLFGASITYFLCNTGAVALIIALTEGKTFRRVWMENFFWTAPYYVAGGALAGLLHFWNLRAGWESAVLIFPAGYLVYRSYRLYLGRLEEEKRHVGEIADLHLRTIQALALAIDARDGTTHEHLQRVQIYVRELGRELNLPEEDRKALEAAALLHDIGKLAVPEYIISKPGKLTPEEFEKMKVHPLIGAEILDSVGFPYDVVPIVRAHHEKWDGSGYPYGLKGEEIPLGARIVSAVDCLDALASDRQYRRALPLDEAMRFVASQRGTSFDPRVVDILERRYIEFEAKARGRPPLGPAKLSTGVRIECGTEPAAGFESSSAAIPSHHPSFISSIAAARQEFQTLLELTNDLGNSLRIDETLALLTTRLKAIIPFQGVAIYTLENDLLTTRYAAGEDAVLFSSLAIPLGEGISGWVTQNNKPIINGNPSVEPGYLKDPAKFSVHRSALSVPLPGRKGVIGALTLYHRQSGAFTRDHLRVLLAVSSKVGLTIENALRFVQAEETSVTDALTGLPNARSLFLRLDAVLSNAPQAGTDLSVMVTDMDGFKQVNDQFGHQAGNQVLEKAAQGFREMLGEKDYAARMGGDEFVLLLSDSRPEVIRQQAVRLNDIVAQVGREVCRVDFLRLSVGVAYYPEDGTNAEELLAIADSRMYEVKRQHHGEVAVTQDLLQLGCALAEKPRRVQNDPIQVLKETTGEGFSHLGGQTAPLGGGKPPPQTN